MYNNMNNWITLQARLASGEAIKRDDDHYRSCRDWISEQIKKGQIAIVDNIGTIQYAAKE